MIFLVTQMTLALLCAVVAGAAAGWLVHRSRIGPTIEALRDTVFKQRAQVEQARTDVSLISQDFDELKQHSRTEIERLAHENRRLPSLSTNLEKSQLLVRQLMQKHEAQLRDLSVERDALRQQLKQVNDREDAFRQVSAELDRARQRLVTIDVASASHGAANTASLHGADTPPDAELGAEHGADLGGGDDGAVDTNDADAPHTSDEAAAPEAPTRQDPPPSRVGSWASARVPDVVPDAGEGSRPGGERSRVALMRSIGLEPGAPALDHEPDALLDEAIELDELDAEPLPDDAHAPAAGHPIMTDSATDDGPEPHRAADETRPGQPADELADEMADEMADEGLLFDPVDRHDDLKQIFGIGPMTEKALNQLGITSYSQLAELEHHDIQTIAEALQIFPSRIERDDWVGNARRQLEDVLEEL